MGRVDPGSGSAGGYPRPETFRVPGSVGYGRVDHKFITQTVSARSPCQW